jgi:hypothetical protein
MNSELAPAFRGAFCGRLVTVISARNVVALRDPRQWRVRAERIRIVADSVNDPGRRRSMLGIADRYERVGKFIEQQQRDLLNLPPALSTRARAQ